LIAIHHRVDSFSQKWIEFCEDKKINYKIVNCYDNDIIDQVKDCDALMWHWSHTSLKDLLFARQLTYSLELMGKVVFPCSKTAWHFDDKVGQKYLLEVVGAPIINSYSFYGKKEALQWVSSVEFPKVFKLRSGAGSSNVKKICSRGAAKKYIKKAFRAGFKARERIDFLKERLWHFRRDKNIKAFLNLSRGLARLIIPSKTLINLPRERGYLYAQDFIPNNNFDIRIIIIGNRAFAIKRMVRAGDFRASGSGEIVYDMDQIPIECVKISFEITRRLMAQCVAFDYVLLDEIPKIVEISYGFNRLVYLDCPGYWSNSLEWKPGKFTPEKFMVEDVLKQIKS